MLIQSTFHFLNQSRATFCWFCDAGSQLVDIQFDIIHHTLDVDLQNVKR